MLGWFWVLKVVRVVVKVAVKVAVEVVVNVVAKAARCAWCSDTMVIATPSIAVLFRAFETTILALCTRSIKISCSTEFETTSWTRAL